MIESQLVRWTKALRSGEYVQGEQYLCFEDCFCCLGVLADITNESVPPDAIKQSMQESLLDREFLPSAGIKTQGGELPGLLVARDECNTPAPRANDEVSLASLNDGMWVTAYELGYMRAKSDVIANIPWREIKIGDGNIGCTGRYGIKLNFQQIADIIEEFGEVL